MRRLLALVALTLLLAGAWSQSTPALARFTRARPVPANALTADTLNAPTGLSATGGSEASLSWTATVDTYAAGYKVFRAKLSGGPYMQIATVTPRTQVTYTDSPPKGTYYYVVQSYFQSWTSAYSTEASAVVVSSVAFDAASSANTGDAASSLSFEHTVGTGSNRALIVGVALRNGSSEMVKGVTFDGTELKYIGSATRSTHVRVELWGLVAPASGTKKVVVSLTGSTRVAAGAMSFTGVDQTSPWGAPVADFGNGTLRTVTAPGVTAGGMVVDVFGSRRTDFTYTVGSGQTVRWADETATGGGDHVRGAGSTKPTAVAGNVTVSWTLSAGKESALVAVALAPP